MGDRLAQDETRINRFIGWLADAANALPRQVWLVFDGVVPECASPPAQQLVTAIARAADREGDAEALGDGAAFRVVSASEFPFTDVCRRRMN